MDKFTHIIPIEIDKIKQINGSYKKEIYEIDRLTIQYASALYKYCFIWFPGIAFGSTPIKPITEYQPVSGAALKYTPLVSYLLDNVNVTKVLIVDVRAFGFLECLLLFAKIYKKNIGTLIYNRSNAMPETVDKFVNVTKEIFEKLHKVYSSAMFTHKIDLDDSMFLSDTNAKDDGKFDLIYLNPIKTSESDEESNHHITIKFINSALKRLQQKGTLVIKFFKSYFVPHVLTHIICSLSQTFHKITYFRDDIDMFHYSIIFGDYDDVGMEVGSDPRFLLTTTTDLGFIKNDIVDFIEMAKKYGKSYDQKELELSASALVNDTAYLKANIDALNTMGLPVKQAILKRNEDLESIQKEYIKHQHTATSVSIDNLNIAFDVAPKTFLFTNKAIDKYKAELNNYQFFIDTRDLKKWRSVTLKTNLPLYIKNHVRDNYNLPNASRAFVKMYEVLATFNLVKGKCSALHICEAPGEFIEATYQYTHTNGYEYAWNANSLNAKSALAREKYGYIFGDFFSLIRKYPKNWLFGADDTGDITDIVNIEHISKITKQNLGDVNFITSDCGLDPTDNPEEHETTMSRVNLAQVLLCLLTLSHGGNAVFKTYVPFSRPMSRSIILLLANSFEKITLTKQIAGSPGSSEIYVVCQNYINKNIDMEYLKNRLIDFNPAHDLYMNYPPHFVDFLENAVEIFIKKQVAIIKRNFYYYENDDVLAKHLPIMDVYKKKLSLEWCKIVDLKKIDTHL